jgi:urease accessory protein
MQLIQRMLAAASVLPPEQQVTVPAQRRDFLKRRWQGRAEDGREFCFDLEARLAEGCVIFHSGGCDYVIRQMPEKVYRIPFESAGHAAFVAWKAGNLHLPVEIGDEAILVLHDEAMAVLLEHEGWAYSEPELLFRPLMAVAHHP